MALKDATFIDSPPILNNDVAGPQPNPAGHGPKAFGRLGQPYTTLHTRNLFDKLRTGLAL